MKPYQECKRFEQVYYICRKKPLYSTLDLNTYLNNLTSFEITKDTLTNMKRY